MSIDVTGNPYGIPLDDLFAMAARINKKRSFLFVSKLLGKHIPVPPAIPLLAGDALARLYAEADADGMQEPVSEPGEKRTGTGTTGQTGTTRQTGDSAEPPLPESGQRAGQAEYPLPDGGQRAEQTELPDMEELLAAFRDPQSAGAAYERLRDWRIATEEPTLFIGFAETATALGHSMFERFEGRAAFLHTTRESLAYMTSRIDFEEEHSHATAHRCYAADPALFEAAERIVLVDDELTTGKTALNIIADLHDRYGKTKFAVASLLDWRSDDDLERFRAFEAARGLTIRCISLVSGKIAVQGAAAPDRAADAARTSDGGECRIDRVTLSGAFERLPAPDGAIPYLLRTGRFGLSAPEQERLEAEIAAAVREMSARRTGDKVLVAGTGEFMYIPMRIAAGMGEGVRYQSTTRSPIHPHPEGGYAVRSAYPYPSPDHPDVMNFMYNIPPGEYDELFFFVERLPDESRMEPLLAVFRQLGIGRIHLVDCSR